MPNVGPLVSPILVGRDDLLALADRRLAEAGAGHGTLLLVAGEPGIGKSRLIQSIRQKARAAGFRVAGGDVVPDTSLETLSPINDLARSMKFSDGFGTLGDRVLGVSGGRTGATSSRRRLVQEVVDLLVESAERPTAIGLEDLQWADEVTLEVLTELARAARERPLFIWGSYRQDALPPGSIHREWRARLVTQRLAEEVRLARLTRDETALVTTLLLGTGLPAPREVVDAVYQRTNGIPLHIEELLAAIRGSEMPDGRAILDAAVPDSIEDSIQAHAATLSDDARQVAQAAAVMGRCFYPEVLAGVMERPVAGLDDSLDELVEAGILFPFEWFERGYYDFRHQLLRDAIYDGIPKRDLRLFHGRAAEFNARLVGASEIHASAHYERAGLRDQAFQVALAAAQAAAAVSSNREALELYRRALDNMPASLPDGEKARVYIGCSDVAGHLDRIDLCRDMAAKAREHALRAGDPVLAVEALLNPAIVGRRDGTPVVERRDVARRLLIEIEALQPGPTRDEFRIIALWVLGIVEMDANSLGEARRLLEEALELATAAGDAREMADMRAVLDEIDMIEGRIEPAFDDLHALADAARETRAEGPAVNAYRMLAVASLRALDYRRARVHLAEGLAYTDAVQQSFCGHNLASTQAVVDWADGRWDDAIADGSQALSDPGSFRPRSIALWALGWTAAGRGNRSAAEGYLTPVLEGGRRSGVIEIQLPAQWGLAEAALVSGDAGRAIELCEDALSTARQRGEWGLLAPFVVTGVRAYQLANRPEAAATWLDQVVRAIGPLADVARPAIDHGIGLVRLAEGATGIARDHLEAAIHGWDERGRRWEALWARLDLASTFLRSNRFADATALIREVQATAEAMGSGPLLARATQLSQLARGRGEELEPWHPLTTREFEVARKIAEGLTNPEIGEQLFVSPKTVSSHVEHILAKLGVSRRAEIAAWTSTVTASPAPMEAASTRR